MAVLGATLFAYNLLALSLPSTKERRQPVIRCEAAARVNPAPLDASRMEQEQLLANALEECWRPFLRWQALVIGIGVAGVVLLALGLYVLVPTWKIRRRRLVPLDEEDAPELAHCVRQLSRQAGLSHPPTLLWNPLAPGGSALAFGRFGRSYVAVDAGLVVQYYTDPKATIAIVRHELAHILNRDVNKAYLALSLWYAFVLAVLLPLLVMELVEGGFLTFASTWRLVALVVLVYVGRNAVLRSREYYADAWAASEEDSRAGLIKVFERIPERRPFRFRPSWGLHPDPGSRASALGDSDRLFHPNRLDVLAAGVLAGFAYPTVKYFLFLLVPLEHTLYTGAGAALLSASLIGVVLGTVALRAGLVARARDRTRPTAVPLALAAASGFAFGSWLSFGTGMSAASAVLLLVLMLASVQWLLATADAWFDTVPGTRSGRRFMAGGVAAAGMVAWSMAWVSVFSGGARSSAEELVSLSGTFIASHSITPVVIASLVLFPMSASMVRRRVRAEHVPAWVAPDDAHAGTRDWPKRPPLRVGRALGYGAVGGIAFCLGILALRGLDVSPRSLVRPVDELAFRYAPGLDYAAVTLAIVLQILVSAVAALRANRLPILHALLALPSSVLLTTIGVALPHMLDRDGLPADLSTTARLVLTGGAIAALAVGGPIEGVRRWWGGRGGRRARIRGSAG